MFTALVNFDFRWAFEQERSGAGGGGGGHFNMCAETKL